MLLEEYLSRAFWLNFPPTFSAARRNCNRIRPYHKARAKIDFGQSRMRTKEVGGRSFQRDRNRGESAVMAGTRAVAAKLRPAARRVDSPAWQAQRHAPGIQVLSLIKPHGHERVRIAVDEAIALGCADAAAIRHLVEAANLAHTRSALIELGALSRYERRCRRSRTTTA